MEINYTAVTDPAQTMWDSEKRSSPYSTVCDPYTDSDYCEGCDSLVDYSDTTNPHGTCGC
jgi:hypothetical protein